jgi:hypothetical protein
MNTQRVITSAGDKTSHYTGVGYQYFFTNDAAHGRTCKMQVAKQMLGDFFKGVGAINSINLPHLEILDQGNGWWMICADQPQNDTVVTRFIARFNRWALARAGTKKATVEVLPSWDVFVEESGNTVSDKYAFTIEAVNSLRARELAAKQLGAQRITIVVPHKVREKSHYTIEVTEQGLGRMKRPGQQRLSSAQPVIAEEGSIKELADKINERFGHKRSK